jgi:hypothetical protein
MMPESLGMRASRVDVALGEQCTLDDETFALHDEPLTPERAADGTRRSYSTLSSLRSAGSPGGLFAALSSRDRLRKIHQRYPHAGHR